MRPDLIGPATGTCRSLHAGWVDDRYTRLADGAIRRWRVIEPIEPHEAVHGADVWYGEPDGSLVSVQPETVLHYVGASYSVDGSDARHIVQELDGRGRCFELYRRWRDGHGDDVSRFPAWLEPDDAADAVRE